MKKLLLQTARPITLVAWIPPFVGSLLGGGIGWHTLTACLGTMVAVGVVNIHNNQADRKIDQYNQAKDTLAVHYPVRNHQLVTAGAPLLALLLRQTGYSYLLLSALFYTGVFYNYFLGRIPVVKRLVVAAVVGATCLLAVELFNPLVWGWTALVGAFIYFRESRKDRTDAKEDNARRFFKRNGPIDPWCIGAPLVGGAVYLATTVLLGIRPTGFHLVITLGQALAIFSFMQIRARHGCYKMWFPHRIIAGQSGLTLALAGLMPPFGEGIMPIVVFNLATIYVRSCLPTSVNLRWWANLHDAYLWASLVWLAMLGPGVFSPALVVTSLIMFVGVFVWEFYRTSKLQAA